MFLYYMCGQLLFIHLFILFMAGSITPGPYCYDIYEYIHYM